MMNAFEFMMPSKIVFGAEKFAEAGGLVSDFGKKALIVCDSWCAENGQAAKLSENLKEAGVDSVIYDGVIPNPTVEIIDTGTEVAASTGCDFLIGLGGGSSMDAAKAIAVTVTHKGSIWPYAIGDAEITDAVLPIVAITTTSGTGSQCTCFSVISNPDTNQKPGMGSPYIMPKLALVDPELMLSAPPQLTANTGFDVFCHSVEAYTSNIASPMSDMYAEKALKLTGQYLERCYKDGNDLEARSGMALADICAGIAICNAVVTLSHAMAHVIGGHFEDIPHGDALYSIYRESLKFNSQALPEKHKFIANAVDPGNSDVVSAFENYFGCFKFENMLKDRLVDNPDMINRLAEDTFSYMKGVADLNPVDATVEDAKRILSASSM